MSKEHLLKKEFKKKDVERIRNLVKGKSGDRTTQGVGYSKQKEEYKEGDIWEENGRKWTIENGIKQNITRLDKAKKAVMPLFCPSCGHVMKKKLDSPTYRIFNRCYDCQAKFEMKLRHEGLFDEWKTQLDNEAIEHLQTYYKEWLEASLNESNKSWISEAGDVQKWVGGVNKKLASKNIEETIEYLESLKK